MRNNPLLQLHSLGQSLWLDQMRRSLLTTGELKRLIDNDGLRGLTSNPTIFEKAISGSQDYAQQLGQLARAGSNTPQIYEEIVVKDIGGAADTFRGVYDANNGGDGLVSLEVSPLLANDTKATIEEAKKLFARLNRPNVLGGGATRPRFDLPQTLPLLQPTPALSCQITHESLRRSIVIELL